MAGNPGTGAPLAGNGTGVLLPSPCPRRLTQQPGLLRVPSNREPLPDLVVLNVRSSAQGALSCRRAGGLTRHYEQLLQGPYLDDAVRDGARCARHNVDGLGRRRRFDNGEPGCQ